MFQKTLLCTTAVALAASAAATAQTPHPIQAPMHLPDAEVGQCYQFVRIGAEYETVMQTVVVQMNTKFSTLPIRVFKESKDAMSRAKPGCVTA